MALNVAGYFERYAPALPFVRCYPPGLHYHVFFYWGGYGSDPFERFDTRVEAESFANDPEDGEAVREDGGHRVHADGSRSVCRKEAGSDHRYDTGQAPQPAQHD